MALIKKIALIILGSAIFLSLKIVLNILIIDQFELTPWLSYLIVTVDISLLGWLYHSKVSFKVKLSGKSLYRYIIQAVVLKVLDYWLYILFVYVFYIHVGLSVFLASGIVFVLRVVTYIFYVFNQDEAAEDTASSNDDENAFIVGRDEVNPMIGDYLGNFRAVYAGYRKVAEDSPVASGGLVSAIARTALEKGYVDGVLLSRADYSKGKVGYEIKIVTDPNEVADFATSTYFNIPLEKHFKMIEEFDGQVGVIALPCHTHMLYKRKALRKRMDHVKFTISLFCGHNNESTLFDFILKMKKVDPIDIDKLWVDRSYLGGMIKIRLKSGEMKEFSFRHFNVYRSLHYFSKGLCRFCDDHLGAEADLSIGDIFTQKYRAKDIQHSAVIVRSAIGEELFELTRDANVIESEAINPEEVFKAQQRVLVPSADLGSRYYACTVNGLPAKKIENGRFRLRSFMTYTALHMNSQLSKSPTWLKILPWIPKPVLYFQIAAIKLINHTLKPGK